MPERDTESRPKVFRTTIFVVASVMQMLLAANLVWNRATAGALVDARQVLKVGCQVLIVLLYPLAIIAFATGTDEILSHKKSSRISIGILFILILVGAAFL